MKRIEYQSPLVEVFNVKLEESILSNVKKSEKMDEVVGYWVEVDEI